MRGRGKGECGGGERERERERERGRGRWDEEGGGNVRQARPKMSKILCC